jgi:hypothetical protein
MMGNSIMYEGDDAFSEMDWDMEKDGAIREETEVRSSDEAEIGESFISEELGSHDGIPRSFLVDCIPEDTNEQASLYNSKRALLRA